MADSFEKRRRAQQKQRKRPDKLERRVQRNVEKNLGPVRSTAMFHTLRRGENEHLTDSDTWLCILDIAAHHGWTPNAETLDTPPGSTSYTQPIGLTVDAADAERLAQSIDAELPEIPDDEVPLTDEPFGEIHTRDLLARRVEGKVVNADEIQAARELLSGPPKRDVARLAEFMRGGAFSVVG